MSFCIFWLSDLILFITSYSSKNHLIDGNPSRPTPASRGTGRSFLDHIMIHCIKKIKEKCLSSVWHHSFYAVILVCGFLMVVFAPSEPRLLELQSGAAIASPKVSGFEGSEEWDFTKYSHAALAAVLYFGYDLLLPCNIRVFHSLGVTNGFILNVR